MTGYTTTTLNYPQLANSPIRRVRSQRNPRTSDFRNFTLGDEWLNVPSAIWWKLAALGHNTATWVQVGASSSGGIQTINSVSPTGGGDFGISGTSPITVTNGVNSISIGTNGTLSNSFPTNSGTANPSGGVLNVLGSGIISTAGSGNTVTITGGSTIPTTFDADSGNATPSGNTITIAGGNHVNTSATAATVTINANTDLASTFVTSSGTATAASNSVTLANGTGITMSGSGHTVTVNASGSVPTTFTEDSGTATPSANNLNVSGSTFIGTSGSGSTVTISAKGTLASTFTTPSGTATTASNNINFANGTGITVSATGSTITINATGLSFTWNEITVTGPTTMAVGNGYIANNIAQVGLTLPLTAALGSIIEVVGKGAGGWKIFQNAGQQIHFGILDSTVGVAGSLNSNNRRDSLRMVCITADMEWEVISSIGNITVT